MDNTNLLTIAMAEQCRNLLSESSSGDRNLPCSLQHEHLLWMCKKIEAHAEDWPATKLHRWIGFIQGALVAHRLLDLNRAKAMFDKAKIAHAGDDNEMIDHLDDSHEFQLDIGGEG